MTRTLAVVFTILSLAVPFTAWGDGKTLHATLTGYEENPTLSTPGNGTFSAKISPAGDSIDWTLSYADTESPVQQAHIHFGARALNGPITVFLCTNLGNGPAGTQPCPAAPATITGTIVAADVTAGAAANGLAAGEFDELIRAIHAGATYANVHTTVRPGGEIRGQIDHDHGKGND